MARRKREVVKGTEEDARQWVGLARYFLRLFASDDVERMSVEELRQLARAKSSNALRFLDNARDGVRFGYQWPRATRSGREKEDVCTK